MPEPLPSDWPLKWRPSSVTGRILTMLRDAGPNGITNWQFKNAFSGAFCCSWMRRLRDLYDPRIWLPGRYERIVSFERHDSRSSRTFVYYLERYAPTVDAPLP